MSLSNSQLQFRNGSKSLLWTSFLAVASVCSSSAVCQDGVQTSGKALTSYERQKGLAFADSLLARYEADDKRRNPSAFATPSADLKVQQRVAELESDIAKLHSELSQVELETDTLRKATAIREEHARLEIDFAKDEALVRHLLAALFAAGYTQPTPGAMHKLTTTLGPVSLTALRDFGALEPTQKGMLQLGHAGSDPSNDRGPYAFPQRVSSELDRAELEYLLPAQRLLIKYQELLVEKGWLAP